MKFESALAVGAFLGVVGAASLPKLPIVDLGYERHQAISFNDSSRTYNFSNIRYAHPPTGHLRFAAPVPVWHTKKPSRKIENGAQGRVCPQASPAWGAPQSEFIQTYLTGQQANITDLISQREQLLNLVPEADPRETEDCLFLDVIAPESSYRKGKKLPVLVWIYGGGYTGGEKTGNGRFDPSGLLARAKENGLEEFVYVAMNYRLGALGFAAGPSFTSGGGLPNAAFYDQHLALEWVQQHIKLFGGDPSRVTVIGESAGGGSIQHQITAFGGKKGRAPFANAIPQSPAFQPLPGPVAGELAQNYLDEQCSRFLANLGVKTLAEARRKSSKEVILANAVTIIQGVWGSYSFGPAVDGTFVPDLTSKLLSSGRWSKNVRILSGHNSEEALFFTAPFLTNETATRNYISDFFPSVSAATTEEIFTELYPPVFDGTQGYSTEYQRAKLITSDAIFTCNAFYLRDAQRQGWAYEFAVPPGLHGQDVAYTFAAANPTTPNPAVAKVLQGYVVGLTATNEPLDLPRYGEGSIEALLGVGNQTVRLRRDELDGQRCRFWGEGSWVKP